MKALTWHPATTCTPAHEVSYFPPAETRQRSQRRRGAVRDKVLTAVTTLACVALLAALLYAGVVISGYAYLLYLL